MRSIFLCLVLLSPLCGQQIEIPPVVPEYTIAKATCTVAKPTNGKIRYKWAADVGVCLVPSESGKLCYVTAKKGTYTIVVTVATCDADKLTLDDYKAQFSIGDVPPTPVDFTELATPAEALVLVEYLNDLSDNILSNPVATKEEFMQTFKDSFALTGIKNEKLEIALTKYLEQSATQNLITLPKVLQDLAQKFAVDPPDPPDPPVPTPGKRVIIIHHETLQDTVEQGSMWIRLRSGSGQNYLKTKGHQLEILDDDLEGKWSFLLKDKPVDKDPLISIIDPQNNKVLLQKYLPSGTTADNVIELIKQNGG